MGEGDELVGHTKATIRPAQLAELPHSEFGPELFPNSAYVKLFCDSCDKKAVLNIL